MAHNVKYDPKYVPIVRQMAQLGATVEEISDAFMVATATVYRWRNEHNDFREALQLGRAGADERVERALYKRAVGFRTKTVKPFNYKGDITYAEFEEEVHPDVAACVNWLHNRKPEEWSKNPSAEAQEAPSLDIRIGVKDAKAEVTITKGRADHDEESDADA